METEELDKIINAYKSLQKLNNDLDELQDSVLFKREIKNRSNMLQKSIDKVLKELYKSMSKTELETFNIYVNNY